MKDHIVKAREEYLAKHPFDPSKNALLAHDETMMPAGFLTLPDMDELSVVAAKFGFEFLAHVRTDDDVDAWLSAVMSQAKSADVAGIIFAHAFRAIAPVLTSLIDRHPGLGDVMEKIAADGWGKEF